MSLPTTTTLRQDFGLIVVSAILFTASFLWRDFFADVRETFFPGKGGLGSRALYTILVTLLLVVAAGSLRNFFGLSPSVTQQQVDDGPDINQPSDPTTSVTGGLDGTPLDDAGPEA